MISFDTNILLAALEKTATNHTTARAFVESLAQDESVAVCELTLLELYTLLRNPTVCEHPLSGHNAAAVVQAFRRHPRWRIVDYAPEVADSLWSHAAELPARRRIYDTRLALTLRHHGITRFATCNVKDFQGFGFTKVWNPLV